MMKMRLTPKLVSTFGAVGAVVMLAACGGQPTAVPTSIPTANPVDVTEIPTAETTVAADTTSAGTAEATSAIDATPEMTATMAMTSTEAMTATSGMTSTPEAMATVEMTSTEMMTGTESGTESGTEPGSQSGSEMMGWAGVYTASLPGPGEGRPVTLTLGADNVAVMQTDNANGEVPVTETGTWATDGDMTATVTLITNTADSAAVPNLITFTISGTTLIGIGFSQPELYGTDGLELEKTIDVGGTSSQALPAQPIGADPRRAHRA